MIAVATAFLVKRDKAHITAQDQSVSSSSTGIQAGRDVKFQNSGKNSRDKE
jgi:hypothetical protein